LWVEQVSPLAPEDPLKTYTYSSPAFPTRGFGRYVPMAAAPGEGGAAPAAAPAAPAPQGAPAPTVAGAVTAAALAAAVPKDVLTASPPAAAPAPTSPQAPGPAAQNPEKSSGAGERAGEPEHGAPVPPSSPSAPADKKPSAEKRLAALEKVQAEQRAHHLDALLKAANVKPASLEFARFKLGAIDPFTDAGRAAIDAFVKANPDHATVQVVREPLNMAWLDNYKPDPTKPRVGDTMPADMVRALIGGGR